MPDGPAYAIIGRGAWAGKMRLILESASREVTCIANARRDSPESDEAYGVRLASALSASGAQIVWLCVAPGPHIACMMRAAIDAGVHAMAEKPWLCSPAATQALVSQAQSKGIRLGVHFEYCLLDEIEMWRERFQGAHGLRFGARFATSRPDRLEIPAMINLGSHLLAMRRYAVPQSEIAELACAYESPDERRAWIEVDERVTDSVDFLQNRQPIIQRFVRKFEAAIQGAEFPFGADFALRVTEDLLSYPAPQTAPSQRP